MQNGNSFVLRNGNAMRWLGGAGDAVRISIKFSPPGPGPHSSDNSILRDSQPGEMNNQDTTFIIINPSRRQEKSGSSGTMLMIIMGHFCINPSSEYGKSIHACTVLCCPNLSYCLPCEEYNKIRNLMTSRFITWCNSAAGPRLLNRTLLHTQLTDSRPHAIYLLTATCHSRYSHTLCNNRTL